MKNALTDIAYVIFSAPIVIGFISLFESKVNAKFYNFRVAEKEKEDAEN
jgi:hypothetical protein